MRCIIAYSRQWCSPFKTGIEGAQCKLDTGHDGPHVAEIVVDFNCDGDILEDFEFEERPPSTRREPYRGK